jgi:hypothetical protein
MRFTRFISSFAAIGAISMLVVAGCSSDDKTNDKVNGGEAGQSGGGADGVGGSGTAGRTTTPTNRGGAAGATTTTPSTAGAGATTTTTTPGGSAGTGTTTTTPTAGAGGTSTTTTPGGATHTAGTTGSGAAAGAGTGGAPPTGSTLEDLIGAICNWEFKCCDAGEAKYQLGPTVATAAACKSAFAYLLKNDNTVKSPYPTSLDYLLTTLGYSIDPAKVTENPTGIAQCIAQYNARTCNVAPAAKLPDPTHCTATSYGTISPCDLSNLVKPKQPAGGECNYALNQASLANDIECVAGTSCVDVGNPDNPSTAKPSCVTRGLANAPCTSDAKCDFGFYCDVMGTGTCVAKGAPGATCAYKNPTEPVPGDLAKQCMPGLTCNPVTKTCIESCKTGYVCSGSDWSCKAGESCIPITVGNQVGKFQTCSAQHSAAAPIPECNSKEDCGAGNYCSGTTCKAILATGDACVGVAGECPAGTYCPTGGGTCTVYKTNTTTCVQAAGTVTLQECNPATAIGCVYKRAAATDPVDYICSSSLLAEGQLCGGNHDCVTNKCEYASAAAADKTCIKGKDATSAGGCLSAASATANDATTCAAGFTCKSGKCVAQVGPGGNCESSTTAGAADADLCKNATCDDKQWKDSSAIMCTDGAVPVVNGGTNASCDGK